MSNLSSERLYGLFNNNNHIIAVSDNEQTIKALMKNKIGYVIKDLAETNHCCIADSIDRFDIIENLHSDKKIMISRVCREANAYKIKCCNKSIDITVQTYQDATAALHSDDEMICESINNVVSHHCEVHNRYYDADELSGKHGRAISVPILRISNHIATLLVRTDFSARSIAVKIIPDPE